MIGEFERGFKTKDSVIHATLARSAKFSGQKCETKDSLMFEELVQLLLNCENSEDLTVRKNALEGLNSIAYKNWQILKQDLKNSRVLQFCYKNTPKNKAHIEIVDLGPFKQERDLGQPMRKAAYQLLETLQDRDSSEYCDLDKLVNEVAFNGLTEEDEEILTLNLNILAKLTERASVIVLSKIDQLVTAFTMLITADKRKKAFISKEERQIKLVIGVLKVVHALNNSQEM